MPVVGLDIGGANLKAADESGRVLVQSFPMWQRSAELASTLALVIEHFPGCDRIAVTMTGELADCFRTKQEGVQFILGAVEQAAAGREVLVWQTGGEFVDLATARDLTPLVAAANWHAQATWIGRLQPAGSAVLIDIGSTTTDIIPLENGFPMPQGRTDPERLACGELVYFGVRRTPLLGLLQEVQLAGVTRPLARELFSTTLDVFLVTGDIAEDPAERVTANGAPATREFALDRLARQLCGDTDEFPCEVLYEFAQRVRSALLDSLHSHVQRVAGSAATTALLSGEGAFLTRQALSGTSLQVVDLEQLLGASASRAACAYALARLAAETPPLWHFPGSL
jgi:probable H4MPT-linked C1 transfer pathway protein